MVFAHEDFKYRHIGPDAKDQQDMLSFLGYKSLAELLDAALPDAIKFVGDSTLPEAVSEASAIAELRKIASKNRITTSLIGQGYYNTHTPAVIKRNVLENPSWYTAYTPYQPEISQGRLEALINFQTMVTDLTGMKTANASMLDESTAAVEAMLIARRTSNVESNVFYVSSDTFRQTRALIEHRAEPVGIEIKYFDLAEASNNPELLSGDFFGILAQYPGASGEIYDLTKIFSHAHAKGAVALAIADLLALTLITPPGEMGADVKGVSFKIKRGTRVAIVGPSGAGKSTIFSLMERFYEPTGGEILLDGQPVRSLSRSDLRGQIGYVEQDAPVLAGSIKENLLIGSPEATDKDLKRVLAEVNLSAVLKRDKRGLDAEVGEQGIMLSGGERQRLAIARTLLAAPPILLLDESTSSLDGLNEQRMREAIDAVAKNRTMIVIAHRLSTVVDSDQIIVIDGGKVIGAGTHKQLLRSTPLYRELAATQMLD